MRRSRCNLVGSRIQPGICARSGLWNTFTGKPVAEECDRSSLQPRYNAVVGSHRKKRIIGESRYTEALYDGANSKQP